MIGFSNCHRRQLKPYEIISRVYQLLIDKVIVLNGTHISETELEKRLSNVHMIANGFPFITFHTIQSRLYAFPTNKYRNHNKM